MAAKEVDQEFVEYVVGMLVTKPEGVSTTRKIDELGVLIELTVDKDDMGVIIGKEGKTAKAIRTLLRVLGAKSDSRINLKIVEPEGSEPREPREHKAEETAHEKVEPAPEVEEIVEEKVAPKVVEVEEDDDLMADLDI
jgi:uncharacterized protein